MTFIESMALEGRKPMTPPETFPDFMTCGSVQ